MLIFVSGIIRMMTSNLQISYKIHFIVFVMLIASAKFPERDESSGHPAFLSYPDY